MHLYSFSYFFGYASLQEGFIMEMTSQLKEMIERYFERYPNLSINSLAQKSGVGATTLRRILSSSLKGDPSPHTLLSIVSVLYKEKKLSKLLPMVEGSLGDSLRSAFSQFVEEEKPHVMDENLNDVLAEKMNYLIYKLAANRSGVSVEYIAEQFGKLGKERAQELQKKDWLILENGFYHAKEKNFSFALLLIAHFFCLKKK